MPNWGEILAELQATEDATGTIQFDEVRERYLTELFQVTGRPAILYYTDWMTTTQNNPATSMQPIDVQGFMGAVHGLKGKKLDLILHVPGGDIAATQSIVEYLRSKFSHIRAIVPLAAMSAGTMLALACDEIVMGAHSNLGPIDPQMLVNGQYISSGALIDDFVRAAAQTAQNPEAFRVWGPILAQYRPGLISDCQQAEALTKDLARRWLAAGMLKDRPGQAQDVAAWFADDNEHLIHSRPITREQARQQGLAIRFLEGSQEEQEAVLSVHHATLLSLTGTDTVKIIENHLGGPSHRFVVSPKVAMVPVPPQIPPT
ncbi:MAG: hypothetical protein F4Y40_00670 [Acidimicrobiia bacterium]|nr:hypothetical protein [Acidimicrobiia bacterium]MYF83660.1 hypothetical protein [Acidimicrobiia bacterium]